MAKTKNGALLMLPGVHQHSDATRRLAVADMNERRTAAYAGLMPLRSRILHRTGSDQGQRVVWFNRRGLSVEMGTWCAGLNPAFHLEQLAWWSVVAGTRTAFEHHVDAPLAFDIPSLACCFFTEKSGDKFLEANALPSEVGIGTVATEVRRVMPQRVWSRWTVCKDRQDPDFISLVFDLVPHGSLHPVFEGILACNT